MTDTARDRALEQITGILTGAEAMIAIGEMVTFAGRETSTLTARLEAVEAERDTLRAEVERLRGGGIKNEYPNSDGHQAAGWVAVEDSLPKEGGAYVFRLRSMQEIYDTIYWDDQMRGRAEYIVATYSHYQKIAGLFTPYAPETSMGKLIAPIKKLEDGRKLYMHLGSGVYAAETLATDDLKALVSELESVKAGKEKLFEAAKEFLFAVNSGEWHEKEANAHDHPPDVCRICVICDKMGDVLYPADKEEKIDE